MFTAANAFIGGHKLLVLGGLVLAILLAVFAVREMGVRAERDRQEAAAAEEREKAEATAAAARERAAAERLADARSTDETERTLTDAGKAQPDARPSLRRCLLNRQRMLNAGARASDLPECGGPGDRK